MTKVKSLSFVPLNTLETVPKKPPKVSQTEKRYCEEYYTEIAREKILGCPSRGINQNNAAILSQAYTKKIDNGK